MRVDAGTAISELVQVGLADENGARDPEPAGQFGVRSGGFVPKNHGARGGDRTLDVAEILQRDGDSMHWSSVDPL